MCIYIYRNINTYVYLCTCIINMCIVNIMVGVVMNSISSSSSRNTTNVISKITLGIASIHLSIDVIITNTSISRILNMSIYIYTNIYINIPLGNR